MKKAKKKTKAKNDNEIMETILAREVRKAIDDEIIKSILDPKYNAPLTRAVFDTPEDEQKFKENWNRIIDREIPGDEE